MQSFDVPTANPSVDSAPAWMSRWLVAAAVYNIGWGAAMVLAPIQTLGWLGVSPRSAEVWPQLWACIGMIVGVYGVGYAIAAFDPLRHWPIVLVGLLGKILGPIGFVDAAWRGHLPWQMGATILTNDLLWWIPFGMILWHAAKAGQPAPASAAVSLDTALKSLHDDSGRSLQAMCSERATLVVLLRHSGCTFCKETLSDLARWESKIRDAGVGLAVVGMAASSDNLRRTGQGRGITTASYFADPDRLLYRALNLGRGSFLQLFGPSVWLGGARAVMKGHGIGRLEGDGFQMPGAFIIFQGRVLKEYRHRTAADRPDLAQMACTLS